MPTLGLLLCDSRSGEPIMTEVQVTFAPEQPVTVGQALIQLKIAASPKDPEIARKGCFGVFGKRKEWDSPIYAGDRLELYAPLQIDPKMARRKKANRDKDSQLKAKAQDRASARTAKAKASK